MLLCLILEGMREGDKMNKIPEEVIEWDVKNWSRAIEFWEKDIPENLEGMKVLDIGGRNGGLSLFWALKGADVVCSDVAVMGSRGQKSYIKNMEFLKK